jgi:Peptidase inhibitor I78 family
MRWVVVAAFFALSACLQTPQTYRDLDRLGRDYQREVATAPQSAEEATRRDTCGASRFQALVGTEAERLDRASLPAHTRVLTPDMMVTQDFSPSRLNIMVGTDGKIGSLACY